MPEFLQGTQRFVETSLKLYSPTTRKKGGVLIPGFEIGKYNWICLKIFFIDVDPGISKHSGLEKSLHTSESGVPSIKI
jgi:hypothetical protein